jgi:ubiquinone/menaquinone biosynthesis C-methylase UbiE
VTTADLFASQATRYEAWYHTPRGRRVDEAERRLLDWLLSQYVGAESLLEIGSGTGHFTGWVATRGFSAIGLDLSAAMLEQARQRLPRTPLVRGDAHDLPLRTASVDLALFVTTLEFLADPVRALAEAARVARLGVAIIGLNRCSLGGFSRRYGRARAKPLLGRARDLSLGSLRRDIRAVTGTRLRALRWTSGLFPAGLWRVQAPLAYGGDVLAVAALFHPPSMSGFV